MLNLPKLAAMLVLLVVAMSGTAAAKSSKSREPLLVCQACVVRGQACGIGGGACCAGLWCHNGACANFQQVGQQCGNPAVPPCQPGLACIGGTCRRTN